MGNRLLPPASREITWATVAMVPARSGQSARVGSPKSRSRPTTRQGPPCSVCWCHYGGPCRVAPRPARLPPVPHVLPGSQRSSPRAGVRRVALHDRRCARGHAGKERSRATGRVTRSTRPDRLGGGRSFDRPASRGVRGRRVRSVRESAARTPRTAAPSPHGRAREPPHHPHGARVPALQRRGTRDVGGDPRLRLRPRWHEGGRVRHDLADGARRHAGPAGGRARRSIPEGAGRSVRVPRPGRHDRRGRGRDRHRRRRRPRVRARDTRGRHVHDRPAEPPCAATRALPHARGARRGQLRLVADGRRRGHHRIDRLHRGARDLGRRCRVRARGRGPLPCGRDDARGSRPGGCTSSGRVSALVPAHRCVARPRDRGAVARCAAARCDHRRAHRDGRGRRRAHRAARARGARPRRSRRRLCDDDDQRRTARGRRRVGRARGPAASRACDRALGRVVRGQCGALRR